MNWVRRIEVLGLVLSTLLLMTAYQAHEYVQVAWAEAHEQDYLFLKAWKDAHKNDQKCISVFTIVPMHKEPCHPLVVPFPVPMPDAPERPMPQKKGSRIA